MNNVVTTLAHSFLIGSSSFLQATSKPIISRMGSKFSRIRLGTQCSAEAAIPREYRGNFSKVAAETP